jgi:hypothetical protein
MSSMTTLHALTHNPIPFLIWVGVGLMTVIVVFFPEAR